NEAWYVSERKFDGSLAVRARHEGLRPGKDKSVIAGGGVLDVIDGRERRGTALRGCAVIGYRRRHGEVLSGPLAQYRLFTRALADRDQARSAIAGSRHRREAQRQQRYREDCAERERPNVPQSR